MVVATDIKVTLSGPFFDADVSAVTVKAINDGLEQVALKGQALVQGQLTSGHGVVTGHFRRSIWGGLTSSLHAQIDAGAHQQGANVVYTSWLETGTRRGAQTRFSGYRMFANAARQLQSLDLERFITNRITDALT